jgi:hypothetical protein
MSRTIWSVLPAIGVCFSLFWLSDASSLQATSEPVQAEMAGPREMPVGSMTSGAPESPLGRNEMSTPGAVFADQRGLLRKYLYRARFSGYADDVGATFPPAPDSNEFYDYLGEHAGTFIDPKSFTEPTWPGAVHLTTIESQYVFLTSKISGVPDAATPYPPSLSSNEFWDVELVTPQAGTFTDPKTLSGPTWPGAIHAYTEAGETWLATALQSGDPLADNWPSPQTGTTHWTKIGIVRHKGTFADPKKLDEATTKGLIHTDVIDGKSAYYRSLVEGVPSQSNLAYPAPGSHSEFWEYLGSNYPEGTWAEPKGASGFTWPGRIHAVQVGSRRLYFSSRVDGLLKEHAWPFPDAGENEFWSVVGESRHAGDYADPKDQQEVTWAGAIHMKEGQPFLYYESLISANLARDANAYPLPEGAQSNEWWRYIGSREHDGTMEDPHTGGFNSISGVVRVGDIFEFQSSGRDRYYQALFSGESQGTFPDFDEAKQYWAYLGQTSLPGTFEAPNLADHMTRPGLIHRFEHEGKRHFVRSRTTGLPAPGGWRFPAPPESNEEWEYIETGEHDGTWEDPKIWSDISWPGAIYAYQGPSLTAGGPTRLFFKSRFLGKPADHSTDFLDANAWEPLGGPAHAGTLEDPILYLGGMTFRGAIHFLPANGTHTVVQSRTNGPSNAMQPEHWSILGFHINEGTLEKPKRWDEYTWAGRIHRSEATSDGKIRFFAALSSGVPSSKSWIYPNDDSSNQYWSYIGTSEHAGTFEDPQQWSDMTWDGAIHRVERSGRGVYYSAKFSGNAEQLNRPYPDKEEDEVDPYWDYAGIVINPGTDQFPRTTAEPVWPGVLVKSGELYYVARNQGVPAKNDWPFPSINDSNDNWRYHGFSRNSGTENNPKDWAEVTWPGAVHQDPRSEEVRLYVSKQSGAPSWQNRVYPQGHTDNDWWTFLKAVPAEGTFDNSLGWGALTSPGKIHSGSVASQTMYFASKFNGYAKPPGTPEEDKGKVFPDGAKDNEWWEFMRKGNGKANIPNVWNDYSLVGDINVHHHNGTRYLFRAKREGRPSTHNWSYPTGPSDNENWEYVSMHDGTLDDPKEWNELSRIGDVHRYDHNNDTLFFRAKKEGNPSHHSWSFPTEPRDNDHWTYIGRHSGLWQDPKSWSEPTWPGAIHDYGNLYFSSKVSGVPADNNWYYPTTATSNNQWQYIDTARYTAPGVNDLTRPFNQYTWATAHNAYNDEYEPQFDRGIRGFMIDIHWDSLRKNVKVCHSNNNECHFERPTLKDVLLQFYSLLERNRNAVITIIFESTVTHDQLRETLKEIPQLSRYVNAGSYGDNWPTLKDMIDSNKRLILFSDGQTSGTFNLKEENEPPLNLYISPNMSSHVENTYNLGTTIIDHDWSCVTRYGDLSLALRKHQGAGERLFILNQFHSFGSSDAHAGDIDNNLTWLQRRVEHYCGEPTGWRQPNFLAIDFNSVGDAFPYAAALSQGGMYFYERNNADREGDTACVLPANQHAGTNGVQYDIRLKSHGCENDEIRSIELEGIRAGTRIQLWDSPDADKQDDFTIIDIKRSIPMGKRVKIDSLEGSSDTFHYRKLAFRNNGLDGKVSRIVVGRTPPDGDISDAEIVFYEGNNGSQNIVCTVPLNTSRHFKMGSGNNSFGCDNDEIRSGVVVKAGKGSTFSVHGNPNGSDNQGKAKVTIKRSILLPVTINSFNSNFENADMKIEVSGGGNLDGKISYAYFNAESQPEPEPDPEPAPDPGAPAAPGAVRFENQWHQPLNIMWDVSQHAVKYRVFKWFNQIAETTDTRFQVHSTEYARFHVRAVDSQGRVSPVSNYLFYFPEEED